MVDRSGQMGVPVITVDDAVVIGFDQPRLEQLLATSPQQFKLGAAVAPLSGGGLLVGLVRPASAAAQAGLSSGDVILDVNGRSVNDADQLKVLLELLVTTGTGAKLRARRDGNVVELTVKMS
jgi:S1-C subfamily serine protease